MLTNSMAMCILGCILQCKNGVCKRLCNGQRGNCTCPPERCMVAVIYGMCGCAVAHACTYAHPPLRALVLLVRATVRTCISIENYSERYIKIPSYFAEIVFSSRNIVRI